MKPTFDKQRVYDLLLTIPKGKVITYGRIAELMGNRTWARAVGNALHQNPDGDRYPCYKVVNRCGELSYSYAFGGKGEQKRRLEADGLVVENEKIDLKQEPASFNGCRFFCVYGFVEKTIDELLLMR